MKPRIRETLFDAIKRNSSIFSSLYHGGYHWRTVERNGLYLAHHTGADTDVISHFAYLHDCMRENEDDDPKHGPRAAKFAKQYRSLVDLDERQFDQLLAACSGHTFGQKTKCPTVATCWDADRLDIGRVGVVPDAQYMFSAEAKRIATDQDFSVLEAYYSLRGY